MRVDIHGEENCHGSCLKRKKPLKKLHSDINSKLQKRSSTSIKWAKDMPSVLHLDEDPLPSQTEGNEAVGIITLEDVIEELLQVCRFTPFFLSVRLIFHCHIWCTDHTIACCRKRSSMRRIIATSISDRKSCLSLRQSGT